MKKTLFIAAAVLMIIMCAAESQAGGRYGGYGSLSTRSYSSGRSGSLPSFKSYSAPAPRNYKNGGEIRLQNGYGKSNGAYVMPHYNHIGDVHESINICRVIPSAGHPSS